MNATTILFAAFLTCLLLAGDYLTMLAARTQINVPVILFWAAVLWVASIPGWYWLDRTNKMSTLGALFAVMSLVGTTAMGIFLFGDRLSPREWAGIGCAFASIMLLSGKL